MLGLALSPHVVDLNACQIRFPFRSLITWRTEKPSIIGPCVHLSAPLVGTMFTGTPTLEGLSDSPFLRFLRFIEACIRRDLSLGTDFSDWVPNPCPIRS